MERAIQKLCIGDFLFKIASSVLYLFIGNLKNKLISVFEPGAGDTELWEKSRNSERTYCSPSFFGKADSRGTETLTT